MPKKQSVAKFADHSIGDGSQHGEEKNIEVCAERELISYANKNLLEFGKKTFQCDKRRTVKRLYVNIGTRRLFTTTVLEGGADLALATQPEKPLRSERKSCDPPTHLHIKANAAELPALYALAK